MQQLAKRARDKRSRNDDHGEKKEAAAAALLTKEVTPSKKLKICRSRRKVIKNKSQRVLLRGAMHLSSIIVVDLIFVYFIDCCNSAFVTKTTVDNIVETLIVVFSKLGFGY